MSGLKAPLPHSTDAVTRLSEFAIEQATDAIYWIDAEGRFVFVNPAACRTTGYARNELLRMAIHDIDPHMSEERWAVHWQTLRQCGSLSLETENRRKDGTCFPVEVTASFLALDGCEYNCAFVRDISRRRHAEDALREAHKHLRLHLTNTPLGVLEYDTAGRITAWNAAARKIFGYTAEEAIGHTFEELIVPEDVRPSLKPFWGALVRGEGPSHVINENVVKSGERITCEWFNAPLRDERGAVLGVASHVQNITETKHAQEALAASEERYRSLFENSPVSLWEEDFSEVRAFLNAQPIPATTDAAAYIQQHPELVGECVRRLKVLDVNTASLYMFEAPDKATLCARLPALVTENTVSAFAEQLVAAIDGRASLDVETELRTCKGGRRDVILRWRVAPGQEKTAAHVLLTVVDVTERRRTENALRFRVQLEHLVTDISARLIGVTPQTLDAEIVRAIGEVGAVAGADRTHVFQFSTAGTTFCSTHEWVAEGVPSCRVCRQDLEATAYPWLVERVDRGEAFQIPSVAELPAEAAAERGLFLAAGTVALMVIPVATHGTVSGFITMEAVTTPHTWSDDLGGPLKLVWEMFTGAVERHRYEEERRALERQVQHSQKLESLGVLAGGIAHDFNNLLTGMLGGAELIARDIPVDSPIRPHIDAIQRSALHAAELTRQMLAYSGHGQFVVEPLDAGDLAADMVPLLGASLPKGVTLQYDLAPDLPAVRADGGQLRQILMNLVMNAGEAIGESSGTVTVATRRIDADAAYLADCHTVETLQPGPYVCVEVADTGVGMAADTVRRIFEPFYTTKFTGRGLGLAAVMGIVRGHAGGIKVTSEPGHGATFQVLLPALNFRVEGERGVPAVPDAPWRGTGTVLIVDDEEGVRYFTSEVLAGVGFTTLTASDGREGVEMYRAHSDEIALVVLDMTMPRMDGRAAFAAIRDVRSDARIVLASGYTQEEATQGFAGHGLDGFLQKPYRRDTLIQTVRMVLDN